MRKLFPVLTILAALSIYSADAWPRKHANREAKTTVTGCLQKGSQPNEYKITSSDGKTYDLTATGNVNLSEHVGHKVTVTGKHEKASTASKTATGTTEEANRLDVTNLKHISNTCP